MLLINLVFSILQNRPNSQGTEVLKIEVQHGSDRHQILLKGQNKTLTVLDLQNEVEKITSVIVKDQRLYHKSNELNLTPFKTLKELEVENNNSVKLIGEPSQMKYSNYFGRLKVSPPSNSNSTSNLNDSYSQLFSNSEITQRSYNQQFPQQFQYTS